MNNALYVFASGATEVLQKLRLDDVSLFRYNHSLTFEISKID
jgi:hypothetical protein